MPTFHRLINLVLWLTAVQTLAAWPRSRSAEQPTQILTLPGAIHAVRAADLNGDGYCDLLISCTTPKETALPSQRLLLAALQDTAGRMVMLPAQTVPPSAIAFDLLAANAQTPARLIYLRTIGLTAHQWDIKQQRFSPLPLWGAHLSPAVPFADSNALPTAALCCSDWPQRFQIATAAGVDIYRLDDRQIFRESRFQSPPRAAISSDGQTVRTVLPRLFWGKMNRDEIIDAYVVSGSELHCYLRGRKAVPNGRPPHFSYSFDDAPLHPSVLAPTETPETQCKLADLNRNGLTDLIRLRAPGARFTTDVSQLRIYYNRGGRYNRTPDQILTAEYFTGEASTVDINADGRTDLVLTHFSTGLGQALRYLLTRRVKVSCSIYPMQPSGRYRNLPDTRFSFNRSVKMTRLLTQPSAHHRINHFTGDRRPDLLAATHDEGWTLFPGDSLNGFSKEKKIEIQAPGSAQPFRAELNSNESPDLIFWIPSNPARREIYIFNDVGAEL